MQILASTTDSTVSLAEAFAAAEYVVDIDDDRVVIRIGEQSPVLDERLDGRRWALVTAHNPDGRRCTDEFNVAAQRALEQCLRRIRPAVLLRACNRDPAGHWPDEPAWLFTPGMMARADRLARRFGQRAIVTGDPGGPAVLRFYRKRHDAPAETTPGAVS